jgi:predicted glycosyltransferase
MKGNSVLFTVRDKENVIYLIKREGFEFRRTGRHYRSPAGKLWGLIRFNVMIMAISLKEKPDIFLSHGSVYTILSSLLLRIPNVSLEDTGNNEQVILYRYFTKAILTSISFRKTYGTKQVRYDGCHELAYLHPAYFTPDPSVVADLGLTKYDKYFIVRFVSWRASHDMSYAGLSLTEKREIVKILNGFGRVFISSESSLPDDLAAIRFPLPPDRMHHALAFARLYVGEGATMASESGILGTTAIYINPMDAGSIDEQESYGLVCHFKSWSGVTEKINEILQYESSKENAISKSRRYINSKTDLTAFLVRFIEGWPGSFNRLKNNSPE